LTFPTMLPAVITSIIETTVAVERLTAFFTEDELQPDVVVCKEAIKELDEETVRTRAATFT
jgi:ATP-binding cassette, subfamily C (CFTR/MRP), member 1